MSIELSILDYIRENFQSDFMDDAMQIVTLFGDKGIFWIIVILLLLSYPKTRKLGCAAMISLIIEALCCNLAIKPLVHRLRPFEIREGIELLVTEPTDYSFPSGHTAASFAVSSVLCYKKSRFGVPAVILSVLIGFSRMYLYLHYLTDVLAGAALGCVTGGLGIAATDYIYRKSNK